MRSRRPTDSHNSRPPWDCFPPNAAVPGPHRLGCLQSTIRGSKNDSSFFLLRQTGKTQPKFGHGLNDGDEFWKISRFSQITIRSQFVTAGDVVARLRGSENDDRDLRQSRISLDTRKHLAPILAG